MKDEEQPQESPKRGYRMPFPLWMPAYALLTLLVSGLLFHVSGLFVDDDSYGLPRPAEELQAGAIDHPSTPPPGSLILKNYASPSQTPQQDLADMSHVLGNFALLVKGDQPIPLGANEEIAAALRGKNRTQLRFVPDDAPCFNAKGQIVDRWQMPLFFHAEARDKIDIRSAGPDKQMWTADDIHRRYDGQFVRGAALNEPSLNDATKHYRGR